MSVQQPTHPSRPAVHLRAIQYYRERETREREGGREVYKLTILASTFFCDSCGSNSRTVVVGVCAPDLYRIVLESNQITLTVNLDLPSEN